MSESAVQNGKNVNGEWIRAKCYVLRVTVFVVESSVPDGTGQIVQNVCQGE